MDSPSSGNLKILPLLLPCLRCPSRVRLLVDARDVEGTVSALSAESIQARLEGSLRFPDNRSKISRDPSVGLDGFATP